MALKRLIAKLEEVPEAVRDQYKKQDDGSFLLDTDDGDYKKKLDEFRDNNRNLNKNAEELTKMKETYKDIDPERYRKYEEELKRIEGDEELKLIKDGKIDTVWERRSSAMKRDYENKLEAQKAELQQSREVANTFRNKLTSLTVDVEIQHAVGEVASIRQGALSDIINRARQTWHVDDKSNMIPKNPDGSVIYGKDSQPLTMKEYVATLINDAPHLFEASKGGGAGGSGDKNRDNKSGTKEKTVDRHDAQAMGRAVSDIAAGKVKVVGDR